MKLADKISAGILVAVCIYFQIRMDQFNPLSRLFPQVIIIILGGLAVLLFVLSFIKPKDVKIFEKKRSYTIPLLSIGMMIVWVACINWIGFLFSSIIFFPLMGVLISAGEGRRLRVLKNCVIALALIGVFFLLFSLLLKVQFPAGKLGIV